MSSWQRKQTQLVVTGYIRDIHDTLSDIVIIPNEIIKLCILFASNSLKILLHTRLSNKEITLNILDINTKTISKLSQYNPSQSSAGDVTTASYCLIENISESLKINTNNIMGIDTNKSYDAIACMETHVVVSGWTDFRWEIRYPSLYLFDPNAINNDVVQYYRCTSSEQLPNGYKSQFLFCGKHNGIIYESNGYLYQSRLEHIDFETVNFNFNQIEPKNVWDIKKLMLDDSYLSLNYLEDENKLFAMNHFDDNNPFADFVFGSNAFVPKEKKIKCGIFDFDELNWIKIADYKYMTKQNQSYLRPVICHNRCDKNVIYVLIHTGNIAQYNFKKDSWNNLVNNGLVYHGQCILWMENNHILCCSDGDFFGYLDIRTDEKEWHKMDDIVNMVNEYNTKSLLDVKLFW